MADKAQQLLVEALTHAATEPAGLPLYVQKNDTGLFPTTALAKTVAERAKADGLLQLLPDDKNTKGREVCVLTDKGLHFLTRQTDPRPVLEDFVRLMEARQRDIQEMAATLNRMAQSLQATQQAVVQVLPRLTEPLTNGKPMNGTLTTPAPLPLVRASDELIADVKARLAEWHASAGASQDCPLPDLYRKLESAGKVSIGLFHDALRQLYDDHQIYLHHWTGPLYALPEPTYALLVGHGVGYYASIR